MKRSGKSRFMGLVVVPAMLVVVVLLITQSGQITEMDTSTARTRVRTYVGGINWASEPRDSDFTSILAREPPLPAQWKEIAGGLNGARVNYLWGQKATWMHNLALWMDLNNLPAPDRHLIATEFMKVARAENQMEVTVTDDSVSFLDAAGKLHFKYKLPAK